MPFYRDAFDLRYNVAILRAAGGFDLNKVPDDVIDLDNPELLDSDEEVEEEEHDGRRDIIGTPINWPEICGYLTLTFFTFKV